MIVRHPRLTDPKIESPHEMLRCEHEDFELQALPKYTTVLLRASKGGANSIEYLRCMCMYKGHK